MNRNDPHAVEQRAIDAETRASKWLADGNVAEDSAAREKCYCKAQFWLDRANLLRGNSDRPAPSR